MNLFRPQRPYTFRPPKYSPILGPLLHRASKVFFLRRKFRIRDVVADGADRVASLSREGHSILVGPNHADHADPHVLIDVGRRHGLAFHFMAAREGFEAKRINSWLLQHIGAFSVDREGADLAAFKTAVQILRDARYPLVVFPEGEIYHHHEQLDALNEGVATMIMRAAAKSDAGRRAYLVPTAMRYTYDESVADSFSARLDALETRITWKPRSSMDAVERIYRLGRGLLALKEMEHLGQTLSGDLGEHITGLRNHLVEMIETKHLGAVAEGRIPERVKTLRGMVRARLTDPEADTAPEEEQSLYDDLDTLFTAVQLYSYPGQYLRETPSVHRIAETILKLEEDVLGEAVYAAPRDVHVRFAEPIDVGAFLEERSLKSKAGVRPLTAALREQIDAMLGELR